MKNGWFSHIQHAVRSEVGLKRQNNEDSHGEYPECGVWCVADGMGGGDDGEVASAAVVQQVGIFCKAHAKVAYAGSDMARGVAQAVNAASRWIFQRSMAKNLKGCGSTFVGLVLDPSDPANALALHAGDSRLYRVRGKDIRQITRDHSAAELIGAKNESDINPMFRGMILRAVGVHPNVDVEQTKLPLKEGDVVILCSDGLSKMVADKAIAAIVRKCGTTPKATADALIEAAYEAGATDNVTVAVLKVGALPKPVPVQPIDISEVASASAGEDTGEAATGDTCVGAETWTMTGAATVAPGSADGTVTVDTEVFRAAEDGVEIETKTWREKLQGRRLLVLSGIALAVVLPLLAFLIWWLGGAEARRLNVGNVTAVRPPSEPKVSPAASTVREKPVEVQLPSEPQAPSVTQAPRPDAGLREVVPATTADKPPAVVSVPKHEEVERSALVARLKAEREKAKGNEKKAVAAEVTFTESIAALIRVSHGRRFDEFVSRIEADVGRSAADRIRLVGSRLAGMKSDDDRAGSAACDLVIEIQKVAKNAKSVSSSKGVTQLLSPVVGLDPATHEAFAACARTIASAGGGAH